MVIERDADRVAQCFLLERELFENGFDREFAGEVTGLVGSGAFVRFGDAAPGTHEGFLPVRRIPGGWWELNEAGTILLSDEGGAIRLGDPVTVRVERVETARGRVDLLPAARSRAERLSFACAPGPETIHANAPDFRPDPGACAARFVPAGASAAVRQAVPVRRRRLRRLRRRRPVHARAGDQRRRGR